MMEQDPLKLEPDAACHLLWLDVGQYVRCTWLKGTRSVGQGGGGGGVRLTMEAEETPGSQYIDLQTYLAAFSKTQF